MLIVVSQQMALADPTRYVFVPGIGHIFADTPPQIDTSPQGSCMGTTEGRQYTLIHNGTNATIFMNWFQGMWRPVNRTQGNRMAWTADYMARAGWRVLE